MKFIKKAFSVFLALALSMACLAACDTKIEKTKVVRISISTSYGTATSNIIREYNLLEKHLPEDVTVEWKTMTSASDMRDALVAGEIDFVCTSLPTFIAGYENGIPLALVSFASAVPIGLYTNDDRINSLANFESTDVICAKSKGNNGHIAFLIACLEDLGDAMKLDNQISTVQEADALALLQSSKDYQASIFSFPMTVKAEDAGLKCVKSFNDVINDYGIGSTYFTRQDFYENEPEIVEALKRAQLDALNLIETDLDGVSNILSPIFGLDAKYIAEALTSCPPTTKYSGYNKLAALLYDIGLVEKEPTKFEDLFNYEDIK